MSIETRVRWGLLSALLASTALVTPAFAQDNTAPATTQAQTEDQSAASDQGGVEEITVTAQRRSERLQDVPIAVTAVTPQALQTAGVTSSLDLPHLATGVTSSPTTANAFFIPYIRGVGSNSPATGNDSSIAIYIDGVYQSDKSANVLDFNNIDRIEVLKGPQGTLFGRNATGGAINIVTLQPSETFTANGEASYQRFDRWTARGYISGPLAEGLSGALAYQHVGGGDYARNTGPVRVEDFGGIEADSFDAKLRWQPNAQFEATLGLNYVDRETTDLNSNLFPVPGTTPVGVLLGGVANFNLYEYSGSPNFYETKATRGTLNMRYSLANMDLVSITGYVHTTDETDLDYDGTSADVLYFNEVQGTNDWSQELQLISTDSGPLQWVLGAYYFDGTARVSPLNLNQGVPYNFSPDTDPTTFPAGGSITSIQARGPTTAEAIYGQATYALTPDTNLTAGLRYTREHREYTFTVSGIGQIAPGFFSPTLIPLVSDDGNRDRTFDKLTWRLALDHNFTPDVMGYLSWNRGFKSGTFNLNDFTPNQAAVNPEQLDAYEAGLKSQWLDHTLQINLAAFYYDYKDIQVDTIIASGSGSSATVLQNAASEHNYGLDVDVIYQPVENFQLRASATFLHAEYESFPDATAFLPDANGNGVETQIDASGERGLFAPEWSFNIGADYTWHLEGGSSVVLSGDYYRTAEFKVGLGPEDRVNEYDSLGMSLTWNAPGDAYYIRGYGQNMTDQQVIGTSLSAVKASRQEIVPASYGVAIGFHF
jgi:iron complex outermembrane receptor protein